MRSAGVADDGLTRQDVRRARILGRDEAMAAAAGRNQPCPCGSGRKYKHCHGKADRPLASPEESTWRRLRRVLDGHPTTMLRFVEQVYGPGAIDEAWDEFFLWDSDRPGFDPNSPHLQVFMPWFFHRWRPDPPETSIEDASLHERSPTSILLERRGHRLDPVLRRYLEACVRAPFSFLEIESSDPGVGFRTRDVFTDEERDVLERSASRTMVAGDLLFGQLVTCDGVTLMEACAPHPIPPIGKLDLIDLRERMAGDLQVCSPESLAHWDIELRQEYLYIMDKLTDPRLPHLQNTDGEDIAFHRLVFDIGSPERAFDALKHLAFDETEDELLEFATRDPDGWLRSVSFAWKTAASPLHRGWGNMVLGHIEIDGNQLVANVNSAGRAARLRSIIEEGLGEEAVHRATKIQSLEDALAAYRARPDAPAEEDPASALADVPEIRERIREMMHAHYEGWVSEQIPALGGLTPLQAIEDRAGREMVEALIAQIERDGRRMEPPLDESVTRRLRERLGLA